MKHIALTYYAMKYKSIQAGLFLTATLTALPRSVRASSHDSIFDIDFFDDIFTVDGGFFDDGGIFQTIANFLLFLVGAVSVIMLIIGGFKYVISGGDSTKVESAKNTIIYAIVGIVVAFLAWAAVDFVIATLEGASGSSGGGSS